MRFSWDAGSYKPLTLNKGIFHLFLLRRVVIWVLLSRDWIRVLLNNRIQKQSYRMMNGWLHLNEKCGGKECYQPVCMTKGSWASKELKCPSRTRRCVLDLSLSKSLQNASGSDWVAVMKQRILPFHSHYSANAASWFPRRIRVLPFAGKSCILNILRNVCSYTAWHFISSISFINFLLKLQTAPSRLPFRWWHIMDFICIFTSVTSIAKWNVTLC